MIFVSDFVFAITIMGIANGNLFHKLSLPTETLFKVFRSEIVSSISECSLMCKGEASCSAIRLPKSLLKCDLLVENSTHGERIMDQGTSEYWIKSEETCQMKQAAPILPEQAQCRPCFSTIAEKYDCLNIHCNRYPYYQGCSADRNFFVYTGGPGTNHHARIKMNPKTFNTIGVATLCYWVLEYKKHGASVSAVHYGQRSDTFCNDFALTYAMDANLGYHTLHVYVLQEGKSTKARTNDNNVHHVCVSWSNVAGAWKFYLDGDLFSTGTGLQRTKKIRINGRLAVAQNVDRKKSGGGWFCSHHLESNNLFGEVSGVYLWHKVLTEYDIKELYRWCKIPQSRFLLAEWDIRNVTLYNGAIRKTYCD